MNKYSLGILGLILIIGCVSLIFSTNVNTSYLIPSKGSIYHSKVCVQKNGELVSCGPNTLTDVGKNMIRDQLTGTNTMNISWIALCNSTNVTADGGGNGCVQPATSDTVLLGEYKSLCGLNRSQGTFARLNNGNFSYANTFTATCNNLVTNVTSIFNSSTTGTATAYFAGNNFTSVTLQTNDQLTVTWYVWIA